MTTPTPQTEEQKAPTALEKLRRLFKSRKFWTMITGLATAIIAHLYNQIDTAQMVMAIIATLAFYCTGIALVDAGTAIGKK